METTSNRPDPFFKGYAFDNVLNRTDPKMKRAEVEKTPKLGQHFNISQIREHLPNAASRFVGRIFRTKSYKEYREIKTELRGLADDLRDRLQTLEQHKSGKLTPSYQFTPANKEELVRDWKEINKQLTEIGQQLKGTVLEKNEFALQLNEIQQKMASLVAEVDKELRPVPAPIREPIVAARTSRHVAAPDVSEPEETTLELDSLVQSITYKNLSTMSGREKLEYAVDLLKNPREYGDQIEEFLKQPHFMVPLRMAFNKVFVEAQSPIDKLKLMYRMNELLEKGMSGEYKEQAERFLNFHTHRMCIDFIRSPELPKAIVADENRKQLSKMYLEMGGSETFVARAERARFFTDPQLFREEIEHVVAMHERDYKTGDAAESKKRYYQNLCMILILDAKFTPADLIKFLKLVKDPNIVATAITNAMVMRQDRGAAGIDQDMASKMDAVLKARIFDEQSTFNLGLFFNTLLRQANVNPGL